MTGLFAGTPLERPVACERCAKSHAACACPRGRDGRILNPKDQPVRVRREKRGGKMVTVVTGFTARSARTDDLPVLAAEFRKKLATGGKADSDAPELVLQGDHREKVVAALIAMGYPAKAAGA